MKYIKQLIRMEKYLRFRLSLGRTANKIRQRPRDDHDHIITMVI